MIITKGRGRKAIIIISAILLVSGLLLAFLGVILFTNETARRPKTFVGVDVAYGDENDLYNIANAVSGYTNLIIVGSLNVTQDSSALTRVCDFLYQKGFYFIVYIGFAASPTSLPPNGPDSDFFTRNQGRWKDKFLGIYVFDEPGGKQIDLLNAKPAPAANSNTDAAIHYILGIESFLALYKNDYYGSPGLQLFTSDYALHWYDYLCNYDVVFGEFNGKQTRDLAVALTRGAAETMGKRWGTMITWSHPQTTLENASQLYDDMVYSWQSGANYIIVFDSPGENGTATTPYGNITTDQLNAIKDFWNYAKTNPQPSQNPAETAYVLPTDYGYGFRGPSDTIWGLFAADSLTQKIWNDANTLLSQYGQKLDIVYETKTDGVPINLTYGTLIYWNGTTIQQSQLA